MNRETAGEQDNVLLGVIVIVLTVFAMSTADAVIKYVSATFPLWQIYVVRSLIVIPLLGIVAMPRWRFVPVPSGTIGWSFLRGLLLALMYVAIYASLPVLSLSTVAASLYTAPLFITLLSSFLIGEAVGPRRWIAVTIGFLGVLVILRPGTDAFSFLALIPVAAALLYALAAIITRARCAAAPPMLLAFALNIALLGVGLVATAAIAVWQPTPAEASLYPFLFGHWVAMGRGEYGVIAMLALLMVGISIGLAKAYQSAPPAIIATFDYSYLPFSVFWSFVLFAERPDAFTVTGMLMIAGAGLLVIRSGEGARRRPAQAGSQNG